MFYAIVLRAAWLLWHLGFSIKVVGRENLPKDGRGFVLAPNHLSAIDPVFVVIARFHGEKMLVMAKEELMHVNPFFTWFFRAIMDSSVPMPRYRDTPGIMRCWTYSLSAVQHM